jgi:hypothetical protein
MLAGITLAGHGREILAGEPQPLRKESRQCETEQDHGEHRGARRIVLRADDGKEDFGRKHTMAAAEHQWIAEIRHAFDEADQEGVGETWLHQRQRDTPEGTPSVGAQRLGSLLHRWADALDDADQHEEGDWREGENLGDPNAGEAI